MANLNIKNFFSQKENILSLGIVLFVGLVFYILNFQYSFIEVIILLLELVVFYYLLRRPQIAIFFLMLWIPLESFFINMIPGSVFPFVRFFPEVLIYGLAIMVIVNWKKYKQKDFLGSFYLWFFIFIILGIISALANSVEPTVAVLGIRQIIRFIFLVLIVSKIDLSPLWFKRFWILLTGVFLFEVILGFVQYLAGGALDAFLLPQDAGQIGALYASVGVDQFWDLGTRVFATLGRYDRYGVFIGFISVIFFTMALYKDNRYKIFKYSWLWFILGVIAVILSSSRAAIFGLILAIIWLFGVILKKYWVLAVFGIILAISAGSIIYYTYVAGINVQYLADSPSANIAERVVEPFSRQSLVGNYYGYGRTFWLVNVPQVVVASSPLWGVGPGMFGSGTASTLNQRDVYSELGLPWGAGGDIGVIDNSWFSLWGEFGTLGLIAFAAMIVVLYLMLGRYQGKDKNFQYLTYGAQAAIIFMVFASFFANHFEIRPSMLLLWLIPIVIYRWRLAGHSSSQR